MQSRCAALQQAFAHLADDLLAEGLDAAAVVAVGFQLLADPARQFGAAGVGEARQLGVVGDRHDAGDHRDVHAELGDPLDEVEIGIGVEEVLGDGAAGAGLHLAHEVRQVILEAARLGVDLRIGGDLDVEVVAGLGADEVHQFVGVAQFAAGHAHARRQVAAQGDDAADAGLAVAAEQFAQLGFRVADTGQVGRGRHLHLAVQLQHGTQRAVAGGSAGAVGAGEEVGLVARQVAGGGQQLFMAGLGLRREELEAETAFALTHDRFLGRDHGRASSC